MWAWVRRRPAVLVLAGALFLLLSPGCHLLFPYSAASSVSEKICTVEVWSCPLTTVPADINIGAAGAYPQVASYQEVPNLWGSKANKYKPYYNSAILFNAVGQSAKGSTLVMTGAGDWKVNAAAFLRVDLVTDAEALYVAYDSRVTPPSWLTASGPNGYARQSDSLFLSTKDPASGNYFKLDLWRLNGERSAGESITIPGNSYGNPGFQNITQGSPLMYVVLVAPSSTANCATGTQLDTFTYPSCPQSAGDDLRPAALTACQAKYPNLVCRAATCRDGAPSCSASQTKALTGYGAGSLVEFVPPSHVDATVEGQSSSAAVEGWLRFSYEGDLTELAINDMMLEAGTVQTEVGSFANTTLQLWSVATAGCVGGPAGFAQPCNGYRVPVSGLQVSVASRFEGQDLLWLGDNTQPIDVTINHATRTFQVGPGTVRVDMEVNGEQTDLLVDLELHGYIADVAPQAVGDLESDLTRQCVEDRNEEQFNLSAAGSFDVYAPSPSNLPRYEWWEDFGLATQHSWGTTRDVVIPRGALAFGSHQISLLVADQDGLVDTDEFDVVVVDTVPPVFNSLPQDITTDVYPAGTESVVVDLGIYSARDACNPQVLLSNDAPEGGRFTPGVHTVTWTADDLRGNVTTVEQRVHVLVLAGPFPWWWVVAGAFGLVALGGGAWFLVRRKAPARRPGAEATTPPPPPGGGSPVPWIAVGAGIMVVAAAAVAAFLLLNRGDEGGEAAGTSTTAPAATTVSTSGESSTTEPSTSPSEGTTSSTAGTTSSTAEVTSSTAEVTSSTAEVTSSTAEVTSSSAPTTLAGPTLDRNGPPTYGDVKLISGFLTDPAPYPITAGGPVDLASALPGQGCAGWAAVNPDFRFDWVGSGLLRFYFIPDDPAAEGADTVLVINDPAGNWHCVDDSFSTFNPTVDFNPSQNGLHEIWVATYNQGFYIPGTLYITELDTNHP